MYTWICVCVILYRETGKGGGTDRLKLGNVCLRPSLLPSASGHDSQGKWEPSVGFLRRKQEWAHRQMAPSWLGHHDRTGERREWKDGKRWTLEMFRNGMSWYSFKTPQILLLSLLVYLNPYEETWCCHWFREASITTCRYGLEICLKIN